MHGARKPAIANDDWLLAQQLRAEIEAEAWRRLREELARPPEPPPPAEARPDPISRGGSAVLKGLVRFVLGAFGAYLAYLAAVDAGLGEFEVWLATGAGFIVSLALSMLGPAREVVHVLAETARWVLIVAFACGAVWLMMQMSA